MKSLQKIITIIEQDLKEVSESARNTLVASDYSKKIARLINANIMPESWSAGFISPPTSIAPIDNPELVILS